MADDREGSRGRHRADTHIMASASAGAYPRSLGIGVPVPGDSRAFRRVGAMRVTVVGLGPGPRDWITPAALARLRAPGAHVFARTRLFPALAEILAGSTWQSLDDVYE